MAMLAEPRRRKRYNLAPRGKALYEDGSRFGTKMLEKMGWSKGKGLGAKENGSQDFVRVRYKNDAEGLGYEVRDDQWTEHEESFNGLLNSLNGSGNEPNGLAKSEISDDELRPVGFGFKDNEDIRPKSKDKLKEMISGVSLEEKSKASKARVHYKKFTRGKDLSQYSEKDLANIFGKKATDGQQSDIFQQFKAINVGPEKKGENLSGVQIISTGMTVSDYFKAKMEVLKNKNNNSNTSDQNKLLDVEELEDPGDIKVKKSKKRKSENPLVAHDDSKDFSKETRNHEQMGDTVALINVQQNDSESEEHEVPLKKKKKKDKQNLEETSNQTVTTTEENNEIDEHLVENALIKKKKDKQESELVTSREVEEQAVDDTPPKKKKNKRSQEHEELLAAADEDVSTTKKQLKNKKKKKEKNLDVLSEISLEPEVTEKQTKSTDRALLFKTEPEQEKNHKVLKKKKHKKSTDDADGKESCEGDKEFVTISSKKKKKRKEINSEVTAANINSDVSSITENITNHVPADNSSDEKSDSSEPTQAPEGLLSLEQLIEARNSFDVYTISSFCAEKFQNFDLTAFKGSSLSQILGYGFTDKIKLNVVEVQGDATRITNLWTLKEHKYGTNNDIREYRKHLNSLKGKKIRKISKTVLKSFKRRNAFTGI